MNNEQLTENGDSQPTEIFNRQDFLNRLGGNEILLKELIAGIPDHFCEVAGKLRNAAAGQDAGEMRHLAHFIKGISANVSAERIRDIACQLENAAKEGKTDSFCSLTDRLEKEVNLFSAAVSDMYPELFQMPKKEEYYEESEIITQETKARLPELLRMLENEFLPEWKKYTDAFFVEETEKLAEELGRMGTEYSLGFLIRYSEKLHTAVQNYNFSEWEKFVAQFPEIMDRIKKLAE